MLEWVSMLVCSVNDRLERYKILSSNAVHFRQYSHVL
jgi:hypothetical protein